jgi:hypothetical protein
VAEAHENRTELAKRLAVLPEAQVTRISVGRWRGAYRAGDDKADYAWIVELGGLHVAGACTVEEIKLRHGPGSYRVSAYGPDSPGLRWEVLIEDL